ncbi:palmitoyl-acyl carrier protein thioesterase, chloroplastic-like [Chenopodium quinoa]|uniref:palmitoyl-acyl carrier protein thioesterase, chloroplastic-like n=1 Tax=Chenopodium quinoa TaxID=63459 RepID=UPI000B77045B|nr:palmitoyl-acyl carrier protein thioesterase, chloroplastic-like [Chenopodium quinoa]
MTTSAKSTSFDYVKTQIFHSRKKNIEVSNFSRSVYGFKKNRFEGSKSFRLYNKIRPNIDVVNGKKINGSTSVGETSYVGLKKCEVIKYKVEDLAQTCMLGKFVEGRFVYKQTFIIRSYEIGPDKTATMETLMNLLQETALNHVTSSGLAGNGFGATREMSLRKLIWVVTRVHVQVNKYSSWGDVVEIDTWVDAAGKNGMRRDWIIRDYRTQNIITRATSTWVTMNRETRRLSKIPDEVRQEVEPFYLNRYVFANGDDDPDKINKLTDDTADIIQSGLAPRWNDMDANQHVNNVKYIGWILESVPLNVLQDYDMTSMTLEYRRECRQANVLESLTTMKNGDSFTTITKDIESTHLLRMQDDRAEIVRARTKWLPKNMIDQQP